MPDTLPAAAPPTRPPASAPLGEGEDRIIPAVVYILFLIGLANGLTIIIGLVVAYIYRDRAGPMMRTHYLFQSRSCWMGLGLAALGAAIALSGILLAVILVGIPLIWFGFTLISLVGVWFAVRCVLGLFYLFNNEPYPRPDTWLI